ncbi:hypothetical protein DV735_g2605, partial [Chaetothyriales sp. CBS 134920]
MFSLRQFLTYVLRQKGSDGEQEQDTAAVQDHHPLLDLPNEIIILVASFLDLDSQVLFSLSCRRMRVLLTHHLDLAFDKADKATKVRYLQCLELAYPEYLTCRTCGFLYRWRQMAAEQYSCPNLEHHTIADQDVSAAQYNEAGDFKSVRVGREVTDLILRAHEHGPDHGLPASFLNIAGRHHDTIHRTYEARMVDGELILACRMEVEEELYRKLEAVMHIFPLYMCPHLLWIVGIINWTPHAFKEVAEGRRVGRHTCDQYKCAFCETDVHVLVEKGKGKAVRMIVDVWRNYGRRYGNRFSNEQIFHRNPVSQLDAETLTKRDLPAAFESGEGGAECPTWHENLGDRVLLLAARARDLVVGFRVLHRGNPNLGPAAPGQPNHRLNEILDSLRAEFDSQSRNSEQVESQVTQQIQEMELIRNKVYQLEQNQLKMKQEYENEIRALRHELELRGGIPPQSHISGPPPHGGGPSQPPPALGHGQGGLFSGIMANQGQGGPGLAPPPDAPPPQQHPLAVLRPALPLLSNIQGPLPFPNVGNNLSKLTPEDLPDHLKKEGPDWYAIFNPAMPRMLDVNLLHNLVHESVVCCVRFSHDGRYVATGCNRSAQIFDARDGKKVCELEDDSVQDKDGDLYIRSVCFSPDGKLLATGAEDRKIRVWDIENRRIRNTFDGHDQDIYSLDFARSGRLIASGSGDKTVRLYDIESNAQVMVLSIEDGVTTVAMSPDGRYVAAGSLDKSVRVWDCSSGYLTERLEGPSGHKDSVYSVAFSPNGRELVSGSLDKTIKMWELGQSAGGMGSRAGKDSKCIRTFEGHNDYVLSVCLTPGGEWVMSGSKDRGVQFWDPATGNAQMMLQGHKNSVISVAPCPTGNMFATGSGDMKARIWSYTPYR